MARAVVEEGALFIAVCSVSWMVDYMRVMVSVEGK